MRNQLNRRISGTLFVLTCVAALGISTVVSADSVDIFGDMDNSTEGLADFTGTLTYDFVLGDMGTLTVDLTNTTIFPEGEGDLGGFLTGFIFNIDSVDKGVAGVLTSTTNNFFLDAQNQMAGMFGGPYVAGAALGGMFLDGGNPNNGIGIGKTGTFTFDITASDADSLTASDFITTGPFDFNFLVRFRALGKKNEFSDMVPGQEVPAPGVLALLGLGALAGRRRRRTA